MRLNWTVDQPAYELRYAVLISPGLARTERLGDRTAHGLRMKFLGGRASIRPTVCGDRNGGWLRRKVRAGHGDLANNDRDMAASPCTQIIPTENHAAYLEDRPPFVNSTLKPPVFFRAYTFSRPCRTNFFLTSTSPCIQLKAFGRALHPDSSRVNLQTAHESSSRAIGFKAEERSVNRRRAQASARVED